QSQFLQRIAQGRGSGRSLLRTILLRYFSGNPRSYPRLECKAAPSGDLVGCARGCRRERGIRCRHSTRGPQLPEPAIEVVGCARRNCRLRRAAATIREHYAGALPPDWFSRLIRNIRDRPSARCAISSVSDAVSWRDDVPTSVLRTSSELPWRGA